MKDLMRKNTFEIPSVTTRILEILVYLNVSPYRIFQSHFACVASDMSMTIDYMKIYLSDEKICVTSPS